MIEILSQQEAEPEAYPVIGGVVSPAVEAAAWQRIEHYTAVRFVERAVVWTVRGPGDWLPPLRPVADLSAEIWDGAEWLATTLDPAPLGYSLAREGPYRITATVGAGPVPDAVNLAAERLAAYLATENPAPVGARSYSAEVGQLSESITFEAGHAGRALINSGAADLLRPYRRA